MGLKAIGRALCVAAAAAAAAFGAERATAGELQPVFDEYNGRQRQKAFYATPYGGYGSCWRYSSTNAARRCALKHCRRWAEKYGLKCTLLAMNNDIRVDNLAFWLSPMLSIPSRITVYDAVSGERKSTAGALEIARKKGGASKLVDEAGATLCSFTFDSAASRNPSFTARCFGSFDFNGAAEVVGRHEGGDLNGVYRYRLTLEHDGSTIAVEPAL